MLVSVISIGLTRLAPATVILLVAPFAEMIVVEIATATPAATRHWKVAFIIPPTSSSLEAYIPPLEQYAEKTKCRRKRGDTRKIQERPPMVRALAQEQL